MSSGAELHAAYQVANAALNLFPYPHFYIENVFPPDFYSALQAMLPEPEDMRPIGEVRAVKGYKERFVLELGSEQLTVLPENKREFWTDPTSPQDKNAHLGVMFHTFVGEQYETFPLA